MRYGEYTPVVMEELRELLEELRDLADQETARLAGGIKDSHSRGYREGFRDAAQYAADGLEEVIEMMEE